MTAPMHTSTLSKPDIRHRHIRMSPKMPPLSEEHLYPIDADHDYAYGRQKIIFWKTAGLVWAGQKEFNVL